MIKINMEADGPREVGEEIKACVGRPSHIAKGQTDLQYMEL